MKQLLRLSSGCMLAIIIQVPLELTLNPVIPMKMDIEGRIRAHELITSLELIQKKIQYTIIVITEIYLKL